MEKEHFIKYEGNWKNNEYNGQGTFTYSSGKIITGIWKNSEYIGK
jgi:hypothetical protein